MISDMKPRILVTLGPSSLQQDIIPGIENENLYLFRINLSHTQIGSVEEVIRGIKECTDYPICLDSEGAQIRTQYVNNGSASFAENDLVKIHFEEVRGDSNNISFTPSYVTKQFQIGDEIRIDFNSACIKIIEKNRNCFLAKVISGGSIGSHKAVDLDREIELETITSKDFAAVKIGKKMGIKHFALSFAGSGEDVNRMREIAGNGASVISKIESRKGLLNLHSIIEKSDEIIIDRGDLSRQVSIEKIPFLQRRIISTVRAKGIPVYVATNLLESMVKVREPTRAEINDVVSTLLMGANGLVLAAETAIGKFPVEAVQMIKKLINQFEKWTPNTSISELLEF
jgi:pyruvate kinase